MQLTGEYHIPAPRDRVWAMLNDPDVLRACIPGCESFEAPTPDHFDVVSVLKIGMIKASVWCNQTKAGERHNVTVARLYRNGDKWVESAHFGRDDLLILAKVVDLAHTWITQSREPSAS